jgi:hypothetical protein
MSSAPLEQYRNEWCQGRRLSTERQLELGSIGMAAVCLVRNTAVSTD